MGYIQGWWGSWPMSAKIPFSIALKSCSTCEEGSSPMTRNKQMVDQALRKEEGTKAFLTQTTCLGIVQSKFSSLPWSSTYNVRRWFGTPGTDLLKANHTWPTSLTPMMRQLPQQVRGDSSGCHWTLKRFTTEHSHEHIAEILIYG